MTLTPKMIDKMRLYWNIDERLEKTLLEQLGSEPYPHTYTEQDLHEQSRKMISRYNEGLPPHEIASNRVRPTRPKTRRDQEAIF